MTVQYASDLHLEFPKNKNFLNANPFIPTSDILILAGDIVPFGDIEKHTNFFNFIADHFQTTYWIPGNHEYYHYDLATKCGVLHEAIRSNVFLVNNISVITNNVRFIFSTMWSKISIAHQYEIERGMNDFRLITYMDRRFSAQDFNRLHEESMLFIREALEPNISEPTIVVTHHVPTFMNYPPMYKGDALNDAFAVELFDLIEASRPAYWIYGHHHYNQPDFKIGSTILTSNQLGYVHSQEHRLFDVKKCIVLQNN